MCVQLLKFDVIYNFICFVDMFIMSLYVLGEHMLDAREHTKLSLI